MLFGKKPSYRADNFDSVVAACVAQDGGAQKLLIKLYLGYAKSISLRYASNAQEAEEIVSDSFLKVFANIAKFDSSNPFKAWLRRIVVNTAIDYHRKYQKHDHRTDIEDIDIADFSEDVLSKISANEILKLVQKLPPSYRTVFNLYVVEGYNHREIAEMLGIREGTSKSNLMDARRKLQTLILEYYPQLHLAYAHKLTKINEN